MRSSIFTAALIVGLTGVAPAFADRIMPVYVSMPILQTAQSDAVVVGKVIEIEKDSIEAVPLPGVKDKVPYKIAVIKITDSLLGTDGLTQVRVGFLENGTTPVDLPRRAFGPPGASVKLTQGLEGTFFLQRHHSADFYSLLDSSMPMLAKTANYDADLTKVKKAVEIINHPIKALKAKEKEDRFVAVQVLLNHYRGRKIYGKTKEVPLSAEECGLILENLEEMPWFGQPGGPDRPTRSSLWALINPVKLGFHPPQLKPPVPGTPPGDFNKEYDEATRKFLKMNLPKLQLTKIVSVK